jgi:hypothetical protein
VPVVRAFLKSEIPAFPTPYPAPQGGEDFWGMCAVQSWAHIPQTPTLRKPQAGDRAAAFKSKASLQQPACCNRAAWGTRRPILLQEGGRERPAALAPGLFNLGPGKKTCMPADPTRVI